MKLKGSVIGKISALLKSILLIVILLPYTYLKRKSQNGIVLYGHFLNGNLIAFYDYVKEKHPNQIINFTHFDNDYVSELRESGYDVLSLSSFRDVRKVLSSSAIISSHGLHSLIFALYFSSIKFFDVWHGVPYKGFAQKDFKDKEKYDEIWVTSESIRKIYIEKYKFKSGKVKPTGYARVDKLVSGKYDTRSIRRKYKLSQNKKVLLIAPTWAHDDKGRSVIPFSVNQNEFFEKINDVSKKNNAIAIFRIHLNSTETTKIDNNFKNIRLLPYHEYPQTEELLSISDVLISEWSSIVFDYLPLGRPTIFIDSEPPFSEGFTLTPEYRFGDVVTSFNQLLQQIEADLQNPNEYLSRNKDKIEQTTEFVYGDTLDGKSAERYYKRLKDLKVI